jgi:protein-S-isoprenylcysteine O-methyltransferase Ste14
LRHPRIRKLALAYLVSVFFLTLMTRFFDSEYHAFAHAVEQVYSPAFQEWRNFERFHAIYRVLYHLIFVIDVGLAVIAYGFASRWLGNRIRSVDSTFTGWAVALICYPPFNQGVADHFIGYGFFATHPLIEAEWARMLLMTLILVSFGIYIWATMALGFKFGNLVNRGIVIAGPYRFMRHPAYAAKNLAWWLDNTQVLTNPGAALSLAVWNVIYWVRGMTEERHLSHDAAYRAYKAITPSRFLPSFSAIGGWRQVRYSNPRP